MPTLDLVMPNTTASTVGFLSRPRPFGRAVVIANPAAGPGTDPVVQAAVARLGDRSDQVDLAWTTGIGHAEVMAATAGRNPDVGLVVAVGGDGTVREVAQALARAGTDAPPLLALPAGSGNSTCRAVWGPLAWPEVLDLALDPARCRVRALDMLHLVEVDALAVLGASTGFLAAVLLEARAVTGQVGIDRYHTAAAKVFGAMPSEPTCVTVDGAVIHEGPTTLAAVGGGQYRAQSFRFLPSSVLDDGLLDVCVIGTLDDVALSEVATLALTGDHLDHPRVTYARGRTIRLEHAEGKPLLGEFDGDVWEQAGPALTIKVLPRSIRMLAPVEWPET